MFTYRGGRTTVSPPTLFLQGTVSTSTTTKGRYWESRVDLTRGLLLRVCTVVEWRREIDSYESRVSDSVRPVRSLVTKSSSVSGYSNLQPPISGVVAVGLHLFNSLHRFCQRVSRGHSVSGSVDDCRHWWVVILKGGKECKEGSE